MTIETQIKRPKSRVFRRAYLKRRDASTGLFESDWQEISDDIKKWSKISSSIDTSKPFRLRFNGMKVVVANDEGKYNPEDNELSFWSGYASRQRSLFKIETGFQEFNQSAGIWDITELPTSSTAFVGVLAGDMMASDKNELALNIKPLTSVFQDYPARNLDFYTSTGLTAQQFMEGLRDQTDGSGSFIFRPFFQDTTTYWDIASSTTNYPNLTTQTADDIIDKNVWQVVEKLSEAENKIPYIQRDGTFNFRSREALTSASQFSFYGVGSFDTKYGMTIKNISAYGKKISDYYSRVEVKWSKEDTYTSYQVKEATFQVNGDNNPWNLGHKTFKIENYYLQDETAAASIANVVFDELSNLKDFTEFTTSFVPHLELLDIIKMNYNSSGVPALDSVWDANSWDDELTWDFSEQGGIYMDDKEFKILSIDIDLDKLQCKFKAKGT